MTRENTIERTLFRRVMQAGGLCLKVTVANRIGFPDRIVLMPGGRVGFAEIKRPTGGRTSRHQSRWVLLLGRYGFTAAVVSTADQVDQFLEELTG